MTSLQPWRISLLPSRRTIQQATLYDETGFNVSPFGAGRSADIQFYHLDPGENGMKYQEPEIWDEERHGQAPPEVVATPTTYVGRENQAYKFSPISLGEGEMVRIKYQVKLGCGSSRRKFLHSEQYGLYSEPGGL